MDRLASDRIGPPPSLIEPPCRCLVVRPRRKINLILRRRRRRYTALARSERKRKLAIIIAPPSRKYSEHTFVLLAPASVISGPDESRAARELYVYIAPHFRFRFRPTLGRARAVGRFVVVALATCATFRARDFGSDFSPLARLTFRRRSRLLLLFLLPLCCRRFGLGGSVLANASRLGG